jgi:putative ABC transport system substrate-binding protein
VVKRRTFVETGLAFLAAPLAVDAQQAGRVARIGLLLPTTPIQDTAPRTGLLRALRSQLRELGWVEGATLLFEPRYAHNRPDRLPGLAAELIRLKVDVIVAVSVPAIAAAKDATRRIPVVMAFSGVDPVRAGFVASLGQPGGNVTGLTILATEVAVKRLSVLKDALLKAARVAVLVNPRNTSSLDQLAALRAAAPALGLQIQTVEITRPGQYADAFEAIARARADAILITSDPEFFRDRFALIDLAARRRTPASYEWREFVEAGGLMSYGSNFEDVAARVASTSTGF